MLGKWAVLVAFIGLAPARLFSGDAGHVAEFPAKIERTKPAVVQIFVNGESAGAGFFISPKGHVLTAFHVAGRWQQKDSKFSPTYFKNLEVKLHDGRRFPAQPVKCGHLKLAALDIALLKADVESSRFLQFGSYADVEEGEEVYFVGYPFKIPQAVTYRGWVSGKFVLPVPLVETLPPVPIDGLLIQAPVAKGFSGAPLLTLKDGKVVAIVTRRIGTIGQKLKNIQDKLKHEPVMKRSKVLIKGMEPSDAVLEILNILDKFISAGAGLAYSTDKATDVLLKKRVLVGGVMASCCLPRCSEKPLFR